MNKGTKKKLNKKMNLKARLATLGLIGGLAATSLTACSDVEAVKDPVEISSEVEDEPIATEEPVVEQPTEEPVVEEGVDYSVEGIINYCDLLINKYPEQDKKEIVAGVISANLDYITDEDLDNVCDVYGYSIDELSIAFEKYMQDYINIVSVSQSCNNKSLSWDEQITIKNGVIVNLDELFMEDDEVKQTIGLFIDSVVYTKGVEDRYVAPEEFSEEDQLSITYESDNISDSSKGIINNFLRVVVNGYDSIYADRLQDTTLPLNRIKNHIK